MMDGSGYLINGISGQLGQQGLANLNFGDGRDADVALFADQFARMVENSLLPAPGGADDVATWRAALSVGGGSDLVAGRDRLQQIGSLSADFGAGHAGESSALGAGPDSDQVMQRLSEEIKSLYIDLTVFSAQWKVMQKIQQDSTHILRGS